MAIQYIEIHPDHFMQFNADTWVGMSNIAGWKTESGPLKVTLYTKDGRSVVSTDPVMIQTFKDHFEEYMDMMGGHIHW